MLKAISILLNRVEHNGDRQTTATLTGEGVWTEANATLQRWSRTAPKAPIYHKVDFVVTFENGDQYRGRFDLQKDVPVNLALHIANSALYTRSWPDFLATYSLKA